MKNTAIMHSSGWIVLGLALALGALLLPCAGLAQVSESAPQVYWNYNDYALQTGHLRYQIADTNTLTAEPIWTEGWEPTADPDGDGLNNEEEFKGGSATVNGQDGVYSYWYQEGKVYLGPGSDPMNFDPDSDGISDYYEFKHTRTNPNAKDTDGDGMPDSVEAYAGLDPSQDGCIYDFTLETNHVSYTVTILDAGSRLDSTTREFDIVYVTAMEVQEEVGYEYDEGTETYKEVKTGKKKMTQQHPDFDIDGDGIANKQELNKATKAINNYHGPANRTPAAFHFPHDILNQAQWTSPLNCDTDGDWLLDPFENAYAKAGFKAVEAQAEDSDTYWAADPDADGLVTFREQCLHPLLAYGWPSATFLKNYLNRGDSATWPYSSSSYKSVYGEDPWKNGAIGLRYSKDRILNGTPGYLKAAQYGKSGDMQRYYMKDKEGNWVLAGTEGDIFWSEPKGYWTTPKQSPNKSYPGPADTDEDGLPDGWEVEHGLNPLSGMVVADSSDSDDDEEPFVYGFTMTAGIDPGAMFGDPDQDGLVNYEEYWGQDGHRIDFITGTGDETSPWIAHGLNYPNESPFDDFITLESHNNKYVYRPREGYQAPYGFGMVLYNGVTLELADEFQYYSELRYPGFFLASEMVQFSPLWGYAEKQNTNWTISDSIVTNSESPAISGLVKTTVRNRVPVPGLPSPCLLNDSMTLAGTYGDDFLVENNTNLFLNGEGAFQPFATAYGNLFYAEAPGSEDGRYTPGVDAVWYASVSTDGVFQDLTMNGDLALADPNSILATGVQGYPLYDNIPLMMPMPGSDTDNDGLVDSMEIQMDIARDKNFSSPVQNLSPLNARSARIVNTNGMQAAFTTDLFVFSRQFTVEAWVFLSGSDPAEGTFVRGGQGTKYAFDLGIAPLRVGGTVTKPVMVDSVPYFGFHTVGGKWYQVSATQPLPRGRWVHLAGTYDPDKNGLSLYIDGVLEQHRDVQEESFATWMLYQAHGSRALLTIGQGKDFANRLWIDEVRIWGVERTGAEIAANYDHLLTGYQVGTIDGKPYVGGLMAYYPFDDGGTVAADLRHRAMSSLHLYDFPAQDTVVNAPRHEYLYPDLAYGFPVEKLGGAFVFDAGNVAPVSGALDSQQGEYDSDGDGLPDSFELQNNMNPFAWYTTVHKYERYDASWGVGDASIIISRLSLLDWVASADGGLTWTNATCPLVSSTAGGIVTQVCSPDVVIIGDFTELWEDEVTTNYVSSSTNTWTGDGGSSSSSSGYQTVTNHVLTGVITNWAIMSGDVRDTIAVGETWWTAQNGTLVSPMNTSGKMMSDADGDNDGDGLTNLQEYWARTNPNKKDTDEDGIPDGEEDFDGDGLPNSQEVDKGSRPDMADTDDDGYDDLEEVAQGTSPVSSREPAQSLAVYFDGKPGSWLAIQDATKYALEDWTIEAKVLPVGYDFLGDGQSATILRRGVESATNGMEIANYELRVVREGGKLYPMARYVYKTRIGNGVVVELRGKDELPTIDARAPYDAEKVTHLAVSYSLTAKRLRLYMDGTLAGERQELTASDPQNGEGPVALLRIGEGFRGFIDDVRVWSEERTDSAILSSMTTATFGSESGLVANFSFDDGGWGGVLTSNTFASERYTDILFSVKSMTAPAAGAMRDGDTWVDGGSVWICDAGKKVEVGTVASLGGVFCEGTVSGTSPAEGMFGWSYVEQMYYRYDGSKWQRWGKTPLWLADVRSVVKGKISSPDQMLNYNPTAGDQFIDESEGIVYLFRETLPMDRPNVTGDPSDIWYVAEVQADPMMPGHRFYLQSQESIVEWDGSKLSTVVHAYDIDGLVVTVHSDGMAYKSDAKRKYFRKWGYVPSLEDSTVSRAWEEGWTTAAQFSGGVQLYRTAASGSGYTPVGGEDSDGDGLPDEWERRYGLDPSDSGFGDNARQLDLDGDGVLDILYDEADFVNGPWGDPDNDGLNNRAEYLAGTNPKKFDTDNNGVCDYDSSRATGGATFGSLYMDGDDIPDGWESLFPNACSPLRYDANLDPDGDGWDNFSEYMGIWKTQTESEWQIVTNEATGVIETNFLGATGYYVPYCLPDDPTVYPQPDVTFHFKVDCAKSGTLRIYAYSDPAMFCADAETSYMMTNALLSGNSFSVTDWTEGGHLRQGDNYFMAFIDEDGDGQWDEGELLGFSENMPENIQWGSADINIALTEKARGYPRVSWADAETASTNGAGDRIAFIFKQGNTVLFQEDRGGCAAARKFFHEYDFMAQPGITGPMFGIYTWSITPSGTTEPSATGTVDLRDYSYPLSKPVVHNPEGTMYYAKTRLRMTVDRGITTLRIVAKDASGAAIYDKTIPAPYVDSGNHAEIDFPQLLGWGALTNGVYTLEVTASNPAASATSDPVTFTVALDPPKTTKGAAMISGTVKYFGFSSPVDRKIVVEAFATSGFDQKPIARTLANADGTYQLVGLPLGETYVRAFLDLNGNGNLDANDAWTVLKGAPDEFKKINWTSAHIRRALAPRGGVSLEAAVSPYASYYSIRNVNIQAVKDYSGNDMVLHDADSDADGLSDSWELFYVGDLMTMNQYTDTDKDGLADTAEFLAGTDPTKADSDGDGLSDADEVQKYGTDPTSEDSDSDGLTDAAEIQQYGTDPLSSDSDGDGLTDSEEINGTTGYKTDPLKTDTDGDGMDDREEIEHGYNPTDAKDGLADDDHDGLTVSQELHIGSDPANADSDGDGWLDGEDPAPTDGNDPKDRPADLVDFSASPTGPNEKGKFPMGITVRKAPMNVVVQSTTNGLDGSPKWTKGWSNTEETTAVGKTITVSVPTNSVGSKIRMFRIIYSEPAAK